MGYSTIEQQIKNYALTEAKMDKVGIASVQRFNESPAGNHPTDFLPGCQSVVVFCTRLPDGAVNAALRTFEDGQHDLHGQYGAFGYVGAPNYNLLWANYKIARFIENLTGETALPQTAGPTHGAKMMSMRHCAVAAGLGEFGWSSIVLTPEFGPRNRFGAVLTTAKLKPDPMYSGPKLCNPETCHICEKMCPTGAIPPYSSAQKRIVDFGEGNVQTYCGINWNKCRIMCHGCYEDFNSSGGNLLDPEITNPLSEDLAPVMKYNTDHPLMHFPQHNPTWKCGNCLEYCPVGNWKERFHDTGISSVNTYQFMDDYPDVDMDTELSGNA